jgi:hypothetical protein
MMSQSAQKILRKWAEKRRLGGSNRQAGTLIGSLEAVFLASFRFRTSRSASRHPVEQKSPIFLAITPVQWDGGVCAKGPLKAQPIESREPEAGFSDIAQIRRLAQ